MELRHIRYFLAVAEELSFRRAAIRLHISQPPLSKQIRDLEEELNTQLFDRSAKRISLTAAGEVFLDRARAILQQVDRASDDIARVVNGNYGKLSFGFVDDTQFGPLSNLIAEFHLKFPDVVINSVLELSPNLVEMLLKGEIDVAIVEPPLPIEAEHLSVLSLPSIDIVAVLPKNHYLADKPSLRMEELCNEKFVICDNRPLTSFRVQVEKLFEEAGFKPRIMHISNATLMFSKISSKAGFVAIASEHAVPVKSSEFRCVPIISNSAKIELSILFDSAQKDGLIDRFVDYLEVNWV